MRVCCFFFSHTLTSWEEVVSPKFIKLPSTLGRATPTKTSSLWDTWLVLLFDPEMALLFTPTLQHLY